MTGALLVFAGGGAGSTVRYFIGLLMRTTGVTLPLATFISNITACLIFAIFIYADRNRHFGHHMHLLLLTGFCGGLSTFSTFGYETWLLLAGHQWLAASLNVVVSTVASIFLFFLATR